jgi:SAM-dependent methyltransferase
MHHDTAEAPKTRGHVIHWARYYDLFGILISFGRVKAIREKLLELAAPSPGESVLDVGCGTGTLAIAMKPRVGEGEVHGIDASPEMIGVANEKAGKADSSVDFQVALIEAQPFLPGPPALGIRPRARREHGREANADAEEGRLRRGRGDPDAPQELRLHPGALRWPGWSVRPQTL